MIVVGLGGMGGSAAYHLAARGQRVLGLERYGPAHDQGASHGGSRITRQSYFEDPAYVPLLLRAYELWEALERDSGRDLMDLCGGLMLGAPDSLTVAGSRRSSEQWGLPTTSSTPPRSAAGFRTCALSRMRSPCMSESGPRPPGGDGPRQPRPCRCRGRRPALRGAGAVLDGRIR